MYWKHTFKNLPAVKAIRSKVIMRVHVGGRDLE